MMSQEQSQESTNRVVAVGVLVVCLVGIALCSVALVSATGAAADTATASPTAEEANAMSGFAIPRWLGPLVALLGSLVAVAYVGSKGYKIVEQSKQ